MDASGGDAYPYEYVYRPTLGWAWVAAPWVWDFGPRVYFSVGPRYFHWYHRPFFRGHVVRGFHGGFRGPRFTGHIGGPRFTGRVGGHIGGHIGGRVGGHVGGRRH